MIKVNYNFVRTSLREGEKNIVEIAAHSIRKIETSGGIIVPKVFLFHYKSISTGPYTNLYNFLTYTHEYKDNVDKV